MPVEAVASDMTVSFRNVVTEDYSAICRLVRNEEELFLVYAQGRFPLTVDQVDTLVSKRMQPTVMLVNDRVAGFGNFYGYRAGRSVVIGNVVVDAVLRGRGLGKRLVTHLIDLAFDEYDLPRVRIHVYNRNLGGLLLYVALGFRPYAMKVKKDHAGNPVVLFTLRLERDAAPAAPPRPR